MRKLDGNCHAISGLHRDIPWQAGRQALPERNVVFSEQDAWEYALVINGWGARLYRSASGETIYKVSMIECVKDADNKTIEVSIPKKILRGNPFNWGYGVLVMGYERLSMKDPPGPMGVVSGVSTNSFKSRGGSGITPVVDIIVPEGQSQRDILKISSYSGSAVVPLLRAD